MDSVEPELWHWLFQLDSLKLFRYFQFLSIARFVFLLSQLRLSWKIPVNHSGMSFWYPKNNRLGTSRESCLDSFQLE